MKKRITLIIVLFISIFANAQARKNSINEATEAVTEEVVSTEIYQDFEVDIDTLKLNYGKKYAIIVNVSEYDVQIAGEDLEEKEVKKNFEDVDLEILKIDNHRFILFENGQTLDMTAEENSFQAFAFWSGNLGDDVEVIDGNKNATEFFSEMLGLDKKSTYNLNNTKHKENISKLKSVTNITEKSKATLNKYFQLIKTPILTENEENWYLQNIPNVKSMKISFTEKESTKIYKNFEFNIDGQPTKISNYNSKNIIKSNDNYIYKNGMLIEIKKEEKTISINYDDEKMIFTENVGDADETKVIWFNNNNNLLNNRYILMNDNRYANQNMVIEDKEEKNCIISYMNEVILFKNCSTQYNVFPYTHSYTSYQDGEFMQFIKYKIEKKESNIFEKYRSSADNENKKDIYELSQTIYLNKDNLISKIINADNKLTITVEYTFYK